MQVNETNVHSYLKILQRVLTPSAKLEFTYNLFTKGLIPAVVDCMLSLADNFPTLQYNDPNLISFVNPSLIYNMDSSTYEDFEEDEEDDEYEEEDEEDFEQDYEQEEDRFLEAFEPESISITTYDFLEGNNDGIVNIFQDGDYLHVNSNRQKPVDRHVVKRMCEEGYIFSTVDVKKDPYFRHRFYKAMYIFNRNKERLPLCYS